MLARDSPEMRETTAKNLADPTWDLEYRQKVWGERGFVIEDGAPKRDPEGRGVIKYETVHAVAQPTGEAEADAAA